MHLGLTIGVIAIAEFREGEEDLEDRIHVARVAEVFETSEARPEKRDQLLSLLDDLGKSQVKVHLKVHLLDGLFCLLLGGDVDTKNSKVLSQEVIVSVIVTSIAVNRSGAVRSDSAELADQRMLRVFEMIYCVIVSTSAIPVLSSTAKMSTGHAEPKVGRKLTLSTVS